MVEFIHGDEPIWCQAYLDTPFHAPGSSNAEEAATKPGNAVKSIELGTGESVFSKYYGILVEYGDECVVRGHGSPVSTKFVWRGSRSEYHSFWKID